MTGPSITMLPAYPGPIKISMESEGTNLLPQCSLTEAPLSHPVSVYKTCEQSWLVSSPQTDIPTHLRLRWFS